VKVIASVGASATVSEAVALPPLPSVELTLVVVLLLVPSCP
jgi:hypothetical protein